MPKVRSTLEESVLTVSLSGEEKEDTDAKIVDASSGYSENIITNKHGSIEKCQGYSNLSIAWDAAAHKADIDTFYAADNTSQPDVLLASGFYRDVTPASGAAESQGPEYGDKIFRLSEATGSKRMVELDDYVSAAQRRVISAGRYRDSRSYDFCFVGGYLVITWVYRSSIAPVPPDVLYCQVVSEEGEVILETSVMATEDYLEYYRVVTNGSDAVYFLVVVNTLLGNDEFHWGKVDIDTATATATATACVSKWTFTNHPANNFHFDAIYLDHPTYGDGACVFANQTDAVTAANTVTFNFFDDSGVRQITNQTKTIAAATDFYGPASLCTVINYSTRVEYLVWHAVDNTNDDIYMGTVNVNTTFSDVLAGIRVWNGARNIYAVTACTDYTDAYDADNPALTGAMCFFEEDSALYNEQVVAVKNRIDTGASLLTFGFTRAVIESEIVSRAFEHRGIAHVWTRRFDDFYPRLFLHRYKPNSAGVYNPVCMATSMIDIAKKRAVSAGAGLHNGPRNIYSTGSSKYMFCCDSDPGDQSTVDTTACTVNEIEFSTRKNSSPVVFSNSRSIGSGSYCAWFDGRTITEYGFVSPPTVISASGGGAGSIPNGTYSFTAIAEWRDANGNLSRSAPAGTVTYTVVAGPQAVNVVVSPPVFPSYRRNTDPYSSKFGAVAISIFRTTASGAWHEVATYDADGQVTQTACITTDAQIEGNRYLYSTTEVAASAPKPGKMFLADNRIWCIPYEQPRVLYYSKELSKGVVPEFTDTHYVVFNEPCLAVSSDGIQVVVLTGSKVFSLSGDGLNSAGEGGFYAPRVIAHTGVTASHRILQTPIGAVWHSPEGVMLYNADSLKNISDSIEDTLDSAGDIERIMCQTEKKWVRFFCANGELIFDWDHNRWSWLPTGVAWDDAQLVSGGTIYSWDNSDTDPLFQHDSGYQRDGVSYALKRKTGWIKVGSLTGFVRIWWVNILGEHIGGGHTLRVKVYHNYNETSVIETHDLAVSAGGEYPYLVRFKPARQKATAIKLEITDVSTASPYRACRLSAVEIIYGYKGPKARRQTLE